MPSRRRFTIGAIASAGTLAMPSIHGAAQSRRGNVARLLPVATTGHLHSVGHDGRRHPAAPSSADPYCLLTSVDLAAKRVRQTPLPMADAHAAVGLGDGRILCMPQQGARCLVVDASHKLMHMLEAPAGYQFFGHALVRPAGQGTIVLTLKRIDFASMADHGLLSAYDFESLKHLASVTSGGLNPHEIVAIPGTDEVCAVHYGHISTKEPPRVRNVKEAKLTVFDGKTLAIKREFQQSDIAAVLSHLRVDDRRHAFCIMQQFVVIDGAIRSRSERLARYYDYCAEILGRPVRFERDPAIVGGDAPVPLPTLRIDTQSGARELILTADDHHLAAQSVDVNARTQAVVASYTFSNTLVVRLPGEKARALSAKAFGLDHVRGVADIPGTPYVVACSSHRGMATIDVRDGTLAGYAAIDFYEAPHTYFNAV